MVSFGGCGYSVYEQMKNNEMSGTVPVDWPGGTAYTWREAGKKFKGLFRAPGPPAGHEPGSASIIRDQPSADSWNLLRLHSVPC